ncbi:MAG: AAA family ATPase [Deltaproteobacteria bacterium]|nr:AAA family ATPase [Deltaproteobacteria bacterium]
MDRIRRVILQNVRAIRDLDLRVSAPFTVLIGENGAGKSTVVECLELLRKAAEPGFLSAVNTQHRGAFGLLRRGATSMTLGVEIEDDAGQLPTMRYLLTLTALGGFFSVAEERLETLNKGPEERVLWRAWRGVGQEASVTIQKRAPKRPLPKVRFDIPDDALLLTSEHVPAAHRERARAALRGIEVQVGVNTLAGWVAMGLQLQQPLRGASLLVPAARLGLLGQNLASAWSQLKNVDDAHWRRTMALVRLGLGAVIDSVNITIDPGGGAVALSLKRADMLEAIPAATLSDGQLTWLAMVAMVQLNPDRALLVIDEPERHLHPHLLAALMELLKGAGSPVLLATHSDAVLELLDDPADAVRVGALVEGGEAVFSQLDPEALADWLARFGDLGTLRARGLLPMVIASPQTPKVEEGP